MMDGPCSHQSGGLLRRRTCGQSATGQCVYCGESFCDSHGIHGEDYYQVCARRRCQAKWQDLHSHKEWVSRHYHHNLAGYCADDKCEESLDISCERCTLRFCQDHVKATSVKEMSLIGFEEIRTLLLCPHCVERRRIWD